MPLGTNEMSRTNSMGLWTYASDFASAATIVAMKAGNRISVPAYYLDCHAIELVLKAFLRAQGCTLDNLKSIGHNLDKLLASATQQGLPSLVALEPAQIEAIAMINPYYRHKELEYIESGYKTFPALDVLHSCAVTLLAATKSLCLESRTKGGSGI